MGFWDDLFGGNKDSEKGGSDSGKDDSGKSFGDTLRGAINDTLILGAVVAGAHAATHEPLSPSTFADQAGHIAAVQQEQQRDAAFDRASEAAREAMDGKK